MQYICAFTEIELEVIFWQQGIGSVLLPEKNHHKRNTKKQQEREAEFTREVILWIVVAVSLLLFISNFGFGGTIGGTVSRFFFGLFGII